MSITSRGYTPDTDLSKVQGFLFEVHKETGTFQNWLPTRFENSHLGRIEDIRIWEEEESSNTEISNVCGHCHVLVRRAFDSGLHGAAARSGVLPGCTACHSNHGTERVQLDRIAAMCTVCHEEGSAAALTGIEIQEQVGRAAGHLHGAAEAIHELTRAGRRTADISVRYQTALSAYMQLSQTQHSLDLEALDDQTRQVASISTDIRGSAEVAAEHQWEHKLLLILIWSLALSATVLAWFKLRGLEKGGQ